MPICLASYHPVLVTHEKPSKSMAHDTIHAVTFVNKTLNESLFQWEKIHFNQVGPKTTVVRDFWIQLLLLESAVNYAFFFNLVY